jgi:hypothetical protein
MTIYPEKNYLIEINEKDLVRVIERSIYLLDILETL